MMIEKARASVKEYNDFLEGREVTGSVLGSSVTPLTPGDRVMVFRHTLSAETDITVPRSQQSHYIGIEGTITGIEPGKDPSTPLLRIKKV